MSMLVFSWIWRYACDRQPDNFFGKTEKVLAFANEIYYQ